MKNSRSLEFVKVYSMTFSSSRTDSFTDSVSMFKQAFVFEVVFIALTLLSQNLDYDFNSIDSIIVNCLFLNSIYKMKFKVKIK